MTFLTADLMVAAFGEAEILQLTDRGRTGDIDETVLAPAMARAEGEVTAILRRRYPEFPTPTIPGAVIAAAADVARYYLHDQVAPELVTERYASAGRFLRDAIFAPADMGLTPEQAIEQGGGGIAAAERTMEFNAHRARQYERTHWMPV